VVLQNQYRRQRQFTCLVFCNGTVLVLHILHGVLIFSQIFPSIQGASFVLRRCTKFRHWLQVQLFAMSLFSISNTSGTSTLLVLRKPWIETLSGFCRASLHLNRYRIGTKSPLLYGFWPACPIPFRFDLVSENVRLDKCVQIIFL
jgi:hypothetical protein